MKTYLYILLWSLCIGFGLYMLIVGHKDLGRTALTMANGIVFIILGTTKLIGMKLKSKQKQHQNEHKTSL